VSSCFGLLCFNTSKPLSTISILDTSGSKQLPWLTSFKAYLQHLSLALQGVSGCCGLLNVKPVDDTCLWVSSWLVAAILYYILSLLTMPFLDGE
jgi:hypothetical protein